MKKLSTISLFIFGVVVTAILVAGLLFYQNNKDSKVENKVAGEITQVIPGTTLNMEEISKHNNQNDCWLLIEGKVYDITSYFGSHPGGSSVMSSTCGTDATNAYKTKDPNAKTSGTRTAHSSGAQTDLALYLIGNFNETIGKVPDKVVTQTPKTQAVSESKTITTTTNLSASLGNITLSMDEIAKHNKQSDCWILISGKVYNITSYFGSHPGGSSTMAATCGEDATAEYATKNPNATSDGGRSAHSGNATSMLASFYLGDLNQTIGQQKITESSTVTVPNNGGDEEEDEDEYEDEEEDD